MLPALNPSREIFVAFILKKIVDCYSFIISSSISSTIIFTVNTIIISWKKEGDQRLL
jgi:hypothetical protein